MNRVWTTLRSLGIALLGTSGFACQPYVVTEEAGDPFEDPSVIIPHDDPPADWIADWTLLIFAANDDLNPNLVAAFDQDALEWQHGLGGSALFRVLVQRDHAPFQLNEEGQPRASERYAIYREQRYHPDFEPTEGAPEAMLLGETDTSNATTLRDFLVYGIRKFPARHYWVTFTGHGDGFAGLADDATTGWGKRLSITDLGIALGEASSVIAKEIRTQPGYGGFDASDRLDVVSFDACRLGVVEVASSIAHAVDYLIASQETIPNAGHPYSALRFIAQDLPESNPRKLVEAVVTNYVRAYVDGVSTAGRAYVGTSVTSVGLDLRRFGGLEFALKEVANAVERVKPGGFSCAEVKQLLVETCDDANLSIPRSSGNTPAAAISVDLIALLERLAYGSACQPWPAEIARAAQRALALIGRPPPPRLEYGGQYQRFVNFGPASPFIVEAQRIDPDTGIRLGGLGVLWGNPYDLMYREDEHSLFETYRSLPFETLTGWTRMLKTCIDEAKACRNWRPAPDEPVDQGPCAEF